MRKFLSILSFALLLVAAMSCKKENNGPFAITVQLVNSDATAFAVEGVTVSLAEASGAATYEATTDASGIAKFSVVVGTYTASCTYKTAEDGVRYAYNGSNSIMVASDVSTSVKYVVTLNKVESQQIIIKELYVGGCKDNDNAKSYYNDAYAILYNNSDMEADASDIVIGILAPGNGNATNKFLTDGVLSYENSDWVPAMSSIWWFQTTVTIPAYSEIVVAFFGGIDHTQTYTNSVDLSKSSYYVMSNNDIAQYTSSKYSVSDNIVASHYLTCSPFSLGNAWVLSIGSPAFFIGRMSAAEALALSQNSDAYDHTQGASAAWNVVKFPRAKVVDAVEVWAASSVAKSNARFPASVNTGYIPFTNALGYTIYRNVDKEATEALTENKDLIVYKYADDPSSIDAQASIKAGAHIIYSDTNNSTKDFHQREVSSLK